MMTSEQKREFLYSKSDQPVRVYQEAENMTLGEMDVAKELVDQFLKVKNLQEEVMHDDETPANQKATVANSVASTLQQLIKMQTDFYTAERFRNIEAALIAFMKSIPLAEAEKFIAEYEKIGENNV